MAQGIHVFGAASIGALRAAELDVFGMRGIGDIYEAFRDGLLEDDDEVAVLHGPEELGYAAADPKRWSTSAPPLPKAGAAASVRRNAPPA